MRNLIAPTVVWLAVILVPIRLLRQFEQGAASSDCAEFKSDRLG